MIIARNGEWLSATIGAECALMCIDNGNYIVLSRVGARIWELIAEPKDLSDICAQLCAEFDVAEDVCRSEVESFVATLQDEGAVKRSPPDA
ncbi:hypothetical protein DBR17_19700 [Sphingomonas sp. HMWF008]|nr:hypothetical protein DBR17_19700 [Sphingomonas sp. HMWF008]